jgi:modulator of FtsH protease
VFVFALTDFMGDTLGPILSAYIGMSGGPQNRMTALAATALVFVGMSGYAMTTRHDLSFSGEMLFFGILVAFLAGIAAVLLSMPARSLAVAAMLFLLMSGLILYEPQQTVRGGETMYIMVTETLFVAIFNLFTSLLHLFGFASQE